MSDFEIASYDRNDCLLCRHNGVVVGQVNVRDLREEFFGGYVIWNLLVFPNHRNQGIGKALIECALANFDDAPVFVSAEPFFDCEGLGKSELSAWYRRLGFTDWEHPQNADAKWMISRAP